MSKLNSKVANTAPVKQVAGTETLKSVKAVAQKIDTEEVALQLLPYRVEDILRCEVRIAEYYARDNIRDIRVRNDYLSIAKLIEMISEGYSISPSYNEDLIEPFFQQVFLIEYWYGNNPDFKQDLKDKNIFPTFIIEHEEGGDSVDEHTAVLGYCLEEPTRNKQFAEDIYYALCEKIFNSKCSDDEIDWYSAYDCGAITNLTISNNLYVSVVGGIAHE